MRLRRKTELAPPAAAPVRPRPLHGVRFDRADQGRRLEALHPRIREFPPIDGFSMWNGSYEAVDAEVLWAILRELRPARVLQVGRNQWAGMVIAAALKANGDDGEHLHGEGDPRDLEDRDVLFVAGAGGDFVPLVLDVLPRMAPGVLVHVHGVQLPWEDAGPNARQDLLQAYLSGNEGWEVLLGLHDLTRTEPELVRRLVPSWRGASRPSAFWLRRC